MRAKSTASAVGRHAFTATLEAVLVVAVVVTLAFATALASGIGSPISGDPVLAARGDRGGGGGGKPGGTTATLVVTPNPVAAGGATYTVTGTGYPAGKLVAVALGNPGCCVAFNVAADATGKINFQRTTGFPGTYTLKTYVYGTTKLLGSTSFVVQ